MYIYIYVYRVPVYMTLVLFVFYLMYRVRSIQLQQGKIAFHIDYNYFYDISIVNYSFLYEML